MDLNADSTYVERNFTEPVKLEDLTLFQCNINEWTNIFVDDSLFGYYYVEGSTQKYTNKNVINHVYDIETGIFYVHTDDDLYYPVQNVEVVVNGGDLGYTGSFLYTYDTKRKQYERTVGAQEEASEITEAEAVQNTDSGSTEPFLTAGSKNEVSAETAAEDITCVLQVSLDLSGGTMETLTEAVAVLEQPDALFLDLEKIGIAFEDLNAYMKYQEDGADAGTLYTDRDLEVTTLREKAQQIQNMTDYDVLTEDEIRVLEGETRGTDYYVVSYVADPLVKKEGVGIWGNDLYVQTGYFLDLADQFKYSVYAVIACNLVIFALSLAFLFASAGHRKGSEGVTEGFVNRIPWELLTLALWAAEVVLFLVISEMSYAVRHQSIVFYGAAMLFTAVVAAWLALGYALDFAVRLKLKSWWRNTLTCRALSAIFHFCKEVGANISDLWKWILLFFVFNVTELLLLYICGVDYSTMMIFWLAEKAVILTGGILVLLQMKKLQDGSRHIADGDTQYQIETGKLFAGFKEHGENLNRINEGVSKAVNEKMKSERFKTELITNVSHDIKTPLTSIINYVDLLEKEEIDNEKANEYLEVLERQSARLKKLIEDLIEASKASSGSLSVNLEKLEAGVFLVQTVGEFEEKTAKSELDLQIKKPEEPIYIMADGRHFWRVIDNLMNNICKYAQPQTRVYINLEETGEKVQIIFRNTSKYPLNISSEELMERFVRGDSSRNTEGNGLGLSIAGSLMELMKGKMTLHVDGDLFKVVLEFDRVDA